MNYRKIRYNIINKYWNSLDPKVDSICAKLSKKINKGQMSKIDTLSDMYLKTYE